MRRGETCPKDQARYFVISIVIFLGFLGLLLITVVEMRRGFLFPMSNYLKVGAPSPILYLNPRQFLLLIIAGLGTLFAYRLMARLERRLKESGASLRNYANFLAIAVMILLIIDLFIYRGVPASRIMAAGKLGLGQAIPLASFPRWLLPLGESINYLALVWHATVLGLLIGALFLSMPSDFSGRLRGEGFKFHVTGAAVAVMQPFCSCCAAPIGSALYRGGASLGPVMAFVVSAPMLNITTLILASVLLPIEFALLRIIGGIAVAVFMTYAVSLMASKSSNTRQVETSSNKLLHLCSNALYSFSKLFQFESFFKDRVVDSPVALISSWLNLTWRLAKVVIPVLFLGSVAAVAIVNTIPQFRNDLMGIIAAAAFGTMLMIPTWTEIPIAIGLISTGMVGPAAAALITLPAVSIPCLIVLVGATGNRKAVLLLGIFVFLLGILAGVLFRSFNVSAIAFLQK